MRRLAVSDYTVQAGNPERADTGKIVNYNHDMEYRRCGKTNLMVSAVALGGHWKRIDKVIKDNRRKAELDWAMDRAWANLPSHYQFLKEWEYV
jgi:hypothetical protein